VFLAVFGLALLTAGSATADPPALVQKRAEAAQILTQIRAIDSQVAHAAEAYNLANIELARIGVDQRRNARTLGVARSNLRLAQRTLETRLVKLYTSGDASGSTLEVLLGSTSIDDLLNRLDTVDRVSSQDARTLRQVRSFGAQVQRQKAALARAHTRQAQVVSGRAARKASIEAQLVQRRGLLRSIEGEISRIQAAERARQIRLEREARARLAQQEREARAARAAAATEAAAAVAAPRAALAVEVEVELELESEPVLEEPVVDAVDETFEAVKPEAPPAQYGGVVATAMQYLGIPYVYGGASPSGFDCSGFVMYVYAQSGVSLPHNAAAQYGYGTPVSREELQPGDLVFFDGLGHNGISIGGDQFIHSPHTGDVVKISSLSDSWYASTWVGARRL